MVYTGDLKSPVERHAGSSPAPGTTVSALSARTAIRRKHKRSCVCLVGGLERLTLFTSAYFCLCGGIGRHAALRSLCRKACWFESSQRHQVLR